MMGALLDRENFVASKLSWQRQLLVDPNLTPFAKVFGSYLMHDLHPGKGGAWRSQSSLAELLAVDLRTIRRAASELVKSGHLKVTVSRGPGRANFYEAVVTSRATMMEAEELRTAASGDGAENRATLASEETENRTLLSASGRHNRTARAQLADADARPSLTESITPLFTPLGAGSDGGMAKPRNMRATSLDGLRPVRHGGGTRGGGVGAAPPVACKVFRNDRVRSAIAGSIGEQAAASYLDPAAWREGDQAIVCRLAIAAEALSQKAGHVIRSLGVTVIYDPDQHAALTSNIVMLAEVA